jgi:hypothetical protein
VCFVASGLPQPTIIRLSTSRRLRIRVSGNIPVVDRILVCGTLVKALPFNEKRDICVFCFTVFE